MECKVDFEVWFEGVFEDVFAVDVEKVSVNLL